MHFGRVAVPGSDARFHSRRGLWIRQIWEYTLLIWVVVGGLACLLAGDFVLLLPLGILSVLVGGIGTLMAALNTSRDNPPASEADRLFR
ncbi:MAG TPA: hypothetical protein VMB73_30770 [Acetobacteraceae bacterium]|nr:hypothetical protein [Acetobacteraceae bacterium]